jgi:RNA polymerase sigma-70 factor (ECF subfamily)
MSPVAAFTLTNDPLSPEIEAAFVEHSRLVYRTAYSVTGSAQDAEDVTQTLFLQLLRRGLPPEFAKNPKAYLYRAAVNLSLNVTRSRRRQVLAADPERLQVAPAMADPHPSNADPALDLQERLVQAMAHLNQRAVEMLVLRYRHGCSEAEIGRLLGTSRGVVAVTLFRARARLKKLLRSSGETS